MCSTIIIIIIISGIRLCRLHVQKCIFKVPWNSSHNHNIINVGQASSFQLWIIFTTIATPPPPQQMNLPDFLSSPSSNKYSKILNLFSFHLSLILKPSFAVQSECFLLSYFRFLWSIICHVWYLHYASSMSMAVTNKRMRRSTHVANSLNANSSLENNLQP